MGNYSISAIFTKEPVVLAGAIRSVLYVLVLVSVVALDEKQLAGIALGAEVILGLFARQGSTSTTKPVLTVGTTVNAGSAVVASVDPPPPPVAEAAKP